MERMKRWICLVFIFLTVTLIYTGNGWTQTTATGSGIADVKIDFNPDLSDRSMSTVNSQERQPHIFTTQGPGTFVFPPPTIDDEGWKPFINMPLMQKFEYLILKNAYKENTNLWEKIFKNYLKNTTIENIIQENKESITRLDWVPSQNKFGDKFYHEGDKILREIQIISDPDWTDIAPLYLGLWAAKETTHTKRVVVWYRPKKEAYTEGISIGTGGAAAKAIGSSAAPGDTDVYLALGGMLGKTWAGIWKSYDFKIWCLNDGPTEPPPLWTKMLEEEKRKLEEASKPKAPAPDIKKDLDEFKKQITEAIKEGLKEGLKKEEAASPAPLQPDPEKEALKKKIDDLEKTLKDDLGAIKEELKKQKEAAAPPVAPPPAPAPKLPVFSILFDFDSAELKPSEKIKIVRAAGWLKEHPKFKLQLEGHCSKEGSYDYNATLGWKRANRVYNALMAAGVSNNTIKQKVSVSKDRPVSENEPENRRVILRAIDQASEKASAKKKVL